MTTCLDCQAALVGSKPRRCWTCHSARKIANAKPGNGMLYQRDYRARKAAGLPATPNMGRPRTYPRCPVCPDTGRCNACRRARYVKATPARKRIERALAAAKPRVAKPAVWAVIKPEHAFHDSPLKFCPTCMTRHREASDYCKRHG